MGSLPASAAILLTLLLLGACDSPTTARDEEAGRAAAELWLARSDGGDHGGAWDTSTTAFRFAVSKEEWETKQTRLYRMLGAPDHRELIAAKYSPSVPGGEPGEYVVVQYRRRINAGNNILETIWMKRSPDGWRTAGYYLMPDD